MPEQRPYLSEEEFRLIRDDATDYQAAYGKFNEVLERVYGRALEMALLNFPEVALKLVQHSQQIVELREDFFKKNPDMQQHLPELKEAVAYFEEQEPAAQYKDTLNKAAEAVRQGRVSMPAPIPRAMPTGPTRPDLGSSKDVDESFKGVLDHGKPISGD